MKVEIETEKVKAREALAKAMEAYAAVYATYKAAKAAYEDAYKALEATPEWAEVKKKEAAYVAVKIEADAALKAAREGGDE